MRDAAPLSGAGRVALEDKHVARSWRLGLDRVFLFVDRHHPEHLVVEGKGALDVPDRQRDVPEAVGLHRR